MRRCVASSLLVLFVVCIASHAECYKILAIVPTPSYSHQIPYRRLWIELNRRGHEVVLVTANPIPDYKAPNFHQIDVSTSYGMIRAVNFVKLRFDGKSWMDFVYDHLWDLSTHFSEQVFKNAEMGKMYAPDSNATFDLVMAELLYMPSTYAFAHRFNAPFIGLSSLGLVAVNEHAMGGLVLPSHEYTWEMEANTGQNLPFLKRLSNFVSLWYNLYYAYRYQFPIHQKLAEKYLGDLPPILDILKNTSMIFIDQSDVVTPARSKLANMITFTSFHVEDKPNPPPKDLQQFMDGAKEGLIYFSLGSNARSSDLPMEVQRMMCNVFSKLPYRVVWKYDEELPEKPNNIYTAKWFPQQSILAHPNTKLFIYQGGLQSSEETINFAVPIIGFPVLADQDYQVARMEAIGVGKRLEITTVTKDEFESAIKEVITNKQYKEKMNYIRSIIKDTPYDLVKNLAWMTEYVIRTKGAPHLRSSLAWVPWYQRHDTDIIVFLTIVAFLVVSISLQMIAKFLVYVHCKMQLSKERKMKIN